MIYLGGGQSYLPIQGWETGEDFPLPYLTLNKVSFNIKPFHLTGMTVKHRNLFERFEKRLIPEDRGAPHGFWKSGSETRHLKAFLAVFAVPSKGPIQISL